MDDKGDKQFGIGDFLFLVYGLEVVFQVVIFQRGMVLNLFVVVVVVGQYEALIGYDFFGVKVVKVDNCIFQVVFIDVVDVFGSYFYVYVLYFLFVELGQQ